MDRAELAKLDSSLDSALSSFNAAIRGKLPTRTASTKRADEPRKLSDPVAAQTASLSSARARLGQPHQNRGMLRHDPASPLGASSLDAPAGQDGLSRESSEQPGTRLGSFLRQLGRKVISVVRAAFRRA